MHQHGEHGEHATAWQSVLLGADDTLEHGVDRLEVGRVGGEIDRDELPALGGEDALGAEVVLHVARALHGPLDLEVALELAEDLAVGLACHVGQHVEATAVRHPDADLVEPVHRGGREDGVHQRDDRLGTFEREALLADVLGLEERLEGLGGIEATQDAQLLLACGLVVVTLDPILDPLALLGILHVHVLDADGAAVGLA